MESWTKKYKEAPAEEPERAAERAVVESTHKKSTQTFLYCLVRITVEYRRFEKTL